MSPRSSTNRNLCLTLYWGQKHLCSALTPLSWKASCSHSWTFKKRGLALPDPLPHSPDPLKRTPLKRRINFCATSNWTLFHQTMLFMYDKETSHTLRTQGIRSTLPARGLQVQRSFLSDRLDLKVVAQTQIDDERKRRCALVAARWTSTARSRLVWRLLACIRSNILYRQGCQARVAKTQLWGKA